MSPSYQYAPLTGKDDIRILTLLPGRFQDPIHVTLSHVPLTPTNIPVFEALSYTWGSPLSPPTISISGSTLAITSNLFTALHYLRYESSPRVLWIDAVCVNQQDLDERSQQVKRMSSIYTLATRVVAWVGEEESDSSFAIETMKEIGRSIVVDWTAGTMKPALEGHESAHWAEMWRELPLDVKQITSITHLLGRSWFERIWIWQEIQLGPPSSNLLCGTDEISWEIFSNAMVCLFFNRFKPDVTSTLLETPLAELYDLRRRNVMSLCNKNKSISFVSVAQRTRSCKCTDPRDRIYATLGLVVRPPRIEPNYRASVGEVYCELFFEVLRNDGNLSVLTYSGLQSQPQDLLPTWVPNWNYKRSTDTVISASVCEASSKSEPDYAPLADGVLALTGLKFATVEHIYFCHLVTSSLAGDGFKEIVALLEFYDIHLKDKWSGKDYAAFCRTLSGNEFSDRFHPPNPARQSFGSARDVVQEAKENPSLTRSDYSPALNRYVSDTTGNLRGRCFFITKEGYIGLGPALTKPGDIVTIFLGCPSAMILRAIGADVAQYKVVGEASCDGFMSGEGLLGPLPQNITMVHYSLDSSSALQELYSGYTDSKEGTLLEEDPRLAHIPLPQGWRRGQQGEFDKPYFINDETSEKLSIRLKDPRLTAVELRKRGVPLQSFMLV